MIRTDAQMFKSIAADIAREIVVSQATNEAAYINLPLRYPGGTSVVVRVVRVANFAGEPERFAVSDCSLGYDEAKMMGVGAMYARYAGEVAERAGIAFQDHAFFVDGVSRDQLQGAVTTVANCSFESVAVVAQRVEETHRQNDSEVLYKRLATIFDPRKVARNVEIIGASSTPWTVDSMVRTDHQETIFETVSKSRLSIYSANTKFRDIADLQGAPGRVAVVRRKSDLKTLLAVLAQAATIIERDVANDVFERVALQHLPAGPHLH